jgi:hypothetical protein
MAQLLFSTLPILRRVPAAKTAKRAICPSPVLVREARSSATIVVFPNGFMEATSLLSKLCHIQAAETDSVYLLLRMGLFQTLAEENMLLGEKLPFPDSKQYDFHSTCCEPLGWILPPQRVENN